MTHHSPNGELILNAYDYSPSGVNVGLGTRKRGGMNSKA
jgi:hypothetical protein